MTEEEARKLIEPYIHYGRVNGEIDSIYAYDVITLLMQHAQSLDKFSELKKVIEERLSKYVDVQYLIRKREDHVGNISELEWVLSQITELEGKI